MCEAKESRTQTVQDSFRVPLGNQGANTSEDFDLPQAHTRNLQQGRLTSHVLWEMLCSFLLRQMHPPQTGASCTCRAFLQPPKKLERAQSYYSGCPSTPHLPESPMPVGARSFKIDWLMLLHITLGMKLLLARPVYSSNIPTLCQINCIDVTSFAEDRKPATNIPLLCQDTAHIPR